MGLGIRQRVICNPALALMAAGLYALNPAFSVYATLELPHIYGGSFVLLAAHCTVFGDRNRSQCPCPVCNDRRRGIFCGGRSADA